MFTKKCRKVLCMDYTGKELALPYWKQIDRLCAKKLLINKQNASFTKELQNTDCLLVKLGAKIDKEIISKAPRLRYIGMLGTGMGGIDIAYAKSKGIVVANIANYATEAVAEFTFVLILNHIREIERAKMQAGKGKYSEAGFSGVEIKGKNFGIIGLGNIGARIAELAKAFGANVIYWSRNRKKLLEKKGFKYQGLEKLLQNSDFITLNISLNPDTQNFIDKQRANMIKKGCVVVNVSPMELVNLPALIKRLGKNDIAFILDHSDEMTGEQLALLRSYPNCIIHLPIGYTTKEATELKQKIFVENLKNFLKNN